MSLPLTANSCIVCNESQYHYFSYSGYQYYRCGVCGHVSTLPLPEEAEIEKHYKNKFENGNYSLLLEYKDDYSVVYLDFIKAIDSQLEKAGQTLQGKKVLDIGCFTGDLLCLMQQRGADVYGLELQPEAVELANEVLPGRVYRADVYGNTFPQLPFDIITFTGLIEHLVDPIKLVKRVYELLNPGGLILLQTPNSGSLPALLLQKYWPPYAPVEHIHLFSEKSIRITLGKNGFRDIVYKRHWKKLPITYVYRMLQNFGPEFKKMLNPFYNICPSRIREMSLSFYAGEMVVTARKPD